MDKNKEKRNKKIIMQKVKKLHNAWLNRQIILYAKNAKILPHNNICNEIAINLSFHFSNCKSMETLNYHSNQSAWTTVINFFFFFFFFFFVEANVRNNSVKCLALFPTQLLRIFLIFVSQILPFGCHGNQSNSEVITKKIYLVEDHSRNISVKVLSNLQWDCKCRFSPFPI